MFGETSSKSHALQPSQVHHQDASLNNPKSSSLCHAQAFSLSLLGNNAEVDLSKVLAYSWTVPSLCAAATYTLSGAYSLVGVCTDDPPFTITVSIDGNAIYSPTGLADNFTVPIPASITEQPGAQITLLFLIKETGFLHLLPND